MPPAQRSALSISIHSTLHFWERSQSWDIRGCPQQVRLTGESAPQRSGRIPNGSDLSGAIRDTGRISLSLAASISSQAAVRSPESQGQRLEVRKRRWRHKQKDATCDSAQFLKNAEAPLLATLASAPLWNARRISQGQRLVAFLYLPS